MDRWEVETATYASDYFKALLKDGWEPFAVIYGTFDSKAVIWMKRRARDG